MTPRPTSEVERLKRTPMTIGVLIAIAFGGAALVGVVYQSEGHVKDVVRETVKQHVDKDIDRAHPDLPGRYATKGEVKDDMRKIDGKLSRIEWNQQGIQETLRKMERRNRSRRGR